MTTLAHTYPDSADRDVTLDLRERTGGSRRPGPSQRKRIDLYERFASSFTSGSHMPLDAELHWDWRNPLNIFPALALLLVIIAIVALIVG